MTDKPILPSSDDLDRYLAGEDSDATQRVRAYLAANPMGEGVLRAVQETVRSWANEDISLDLHKSLNTITSTTSTKKSPKIHIPFTYIGIAAALVIGFFALKHIPNLTNTTQTSVPQTETYTTTPGQRANIQLSDGSSVIIAPATTMNVTGRNVQLQGEAVFTVTQHASTPFTVQAGSTITRVLGTTFGVRAYDSQIRVAVRDGRVSVQGSESGFRERASAANAERSSAVVPLQQQGQARTSSRRESQTATVLEAGDVAMFTNNQIQVQHNANIDVMLAWTEGRFSFRGQPLSEVVLELSRHYASEIVITTPSLSSRKVLLDVAPNDSLSEVLNALAGAIGARIERHGVRYLILGA